MTAPEVAKHIYSTKPKASPDTVRKLAAQWSSEPTFLDAVVAQYTLIRMKTTRFSEESLPEERPPGTTTPR